MASLTQFDWQPAQYEPDEGRDFSPIPAGTYQVYISSSDIKPTKTGNGDLISLEFTVAEGEHQGRKVFDRLCTEHPKADTAQIARRKFRAICEAVGVLSPQDTEELHDRPLEITIKVKPAKDDYPAGNDVTKYAPLGTAAKKPPAAVAPRPQTATRPSVPATSTPAAPTPPWKKGA